MREKIEYLKKIDEEKIDNSKKFEKDYFKRFDKSYNWIDIDDDGKFIGDPYYSQDSDIDWRCRNYEDYLREYREAEEIWE